MAGPPVDNDIAPLLQRFKGLTAHPPQERMWPELRKVLEGFAQTVPGEDAEAEALAAWGDAAAELAAMLYVKALRSEDPELEDIFFQGLAGCGLAGCLCMAQFIRQRFQRGADDPKPPNPEALLARVPESCIPEVFNDILLAPFAEHPDLCRAVIKILERGVSDPQAILDMAASQAETLGGLSFAIQDGLLQGEFGPSLLSVLERQGENVQGGLRPDDETYPALKAVSAMGRPALCAKVAPLMTVKYLPALLAVLTTMRRLGGRDIRLAKLASKLLMHPESRVQLAAMDLLLVMTPKDLGKVLAVLFKKNQELRPRILSRLPLLPRAEYERFMASLPKGAGPALLPDLLAVTATLDPATIREGLELAAAQKPGKAPGKALDELLELIPVRAAPADCDADKAVENFQKTLPKAKPKPKKQEKSSLFSRFGGGDDEAVNVQFGVDTGPGQSDASGRKLSAPIYDGQPLNRLKFNKTFLDGGVFQNCTLRDVDFSQALLRGVRFENCVLDGCDFTDARLHDCDFYDVRMSGCLLHGALFCSSRVVLADASGCDMRGLRLYGCALKTCRLQAVDMTGAVFTHTGLAGTELLHCILNNMTLENSAIIHSTLAATPATGCRVEGLLTDNARCMELEEHWLQLGAMAADPLPEMGRKVTPKAAELAGKALANWYRRRDMRAMERAFLSNNARRVSWCMEKIGPEKTEFFRLAPLLIHSTAFEDHHDEVPALPLAMRMSVYQPDYTTMEAARKHFPNIALPKPEPDPVRIEALYTIGSVGTIAQTAKSDLDYWVCYDPEDMPDILVDGLTYKLKQIEKWADKRFGLEVHFFTMDKTRIQENNFGVSDQESSGTAQAMLLKEEFYRTAVAVAGMSPAWWLTEIGADNEEYADVLDFVRRTRDRDRIIDLGNMVRIPVAEFFGASLWQIVKALKSPFKSIMKFGLLEKYISAGDKGGDEGESRLLCDRLKQNLRRGRDSLLYADPYTLLFREVSDYYRLAKNKESLQLVRLSFVLKTKINQQCLAGRLATRRELREVDDLFSPRDNAPPLCSRGGMIGDDWPFDKLVSVGGLVNKFIVRTYMRVRDSQAGAADVAITPQDMTKLGRKISTSFTRRKHKIEHVPFVSMGAGNFRVLHFSAYGKKMGSPSEWECKGAQKVASSQHRLLLADLRKGKDLAEMLVWLAANGLYGPGMPIKGDYSISPVTAKDIQNLLNKLLDFFPPGSTFNTDIGETLNPERIVKAFLVLNLVRPREQNRLLEVSIVYSTNWGELFCRTMAADNDALISNPVEFLLQSVEQEFTEPPEMTYFVPERSMCPRPNLG